MDMKKTGALIVGARKELNMTQRGLHLSPQAVSKWERGLSFPDVALLEALGEELNLTVSELLAGERNAPAREELVRDSLRTAAAQWGPKVRRWRGFFGAAAALLALLLLTLGYNYLREHTELLPQAETVVTPTPLAGELRELTDFVTNGADLYLFDVELADDFTDYSFQMELWTEGGLKQGWDLGRTSGVANFGVERRQRLAFLYRSDHIDLEDESSTGLLRYSIHFLASRTAGLEIPYLENGYVLDALDRAETLSREHGLVLLAFALDPQRDGVFCPYDNLGVVETPTMEPGEAALLLRMETKNGKSS